MAKCSACEQKRRNRIAVARAAMKVKTNKQANSTRVSSTANAVLRKLGLRRNT